MDDCHLMLSGTTYLDHAGTTPYPKSLMKSFEKEMNSYLFGNPHSHSPASMLSTDQLESTRIEALKFFNADPKHFDLIFVVNATAAIKLVADCISDYSQRQGGFWYRYHADAHTSLVGIREVAARGSHCFLSDHDVDDWLSARVQSDSRTSRLLSEDDEVTTLFAYPGQSNMNGRRLPLSWPRRIRSSALHGAGKVYSLLDAAALVATAPLDLSDHDNAPDFIALSFYKIFGFPDLGALIVRKAAGHVLSQRRYFGGGTVDMVINGEGPTKEDWYARKATSIHEMLEDGTPAFHSIIALRIGLRIHKQLFGSMMNVSMHTSALAKVLYEEMSTLSHANGLTVCQVYKNRSSVYGDSKTQGPTIAFNLRDSKGDLIGKSDFETLATLNNVQIRTGGLCNPGGIASSLKLSPASMRENFEEGVRCGNEIDEMHGKPTGVIRVSLGAMSSQKDVAKFLNLLQLFVDNRTRSPHDVVTFESGTIIERSSMQIESRLPKLEYVVKVTGINATFTCPVATCREPFRSKNELSNHFLTHQVTRGWSRLWCFK